MATQHSTTPRLSNNLVLAYDGDGQEHFLFVVDHPSSMVSIVDGEVIRSMTPADAAALVLALVAALGGCLR